MTIEQRGNAITNLAKCCPIALTVPVQALFDGVDAPDGHCQTNQ